MDNKTIVIIFTRGLQGSGKSTWAKQFIKENQNYKRVCRDDLRHMISSYTFNNENEEIITNIENQIIENLIKLNFNLIIDKMNLNIKQFEKDLTFILSICSQYKIRFDYVVKEFPITLSEALDRDSKREFKIGNKVIKDTYSRYEIELKQMIERNKPKIKYNSKLIDCIVIDIDGTLADSTNRKIFDDTLVNTDRVIEPVKELLLFNFNKKEKIRKIFIFSGRQDSCKEQTEEWLYSNNIPFDFLIMRKTDDFRCDTIVKREMYEEYIKDKYNCLYVIDDRPKVLEMWQSLGLFTFNVNQDVYAKNNF